MSNTQEKSVSSGVYLQLIIITLLTLFVITASFYSGKLITKSSSNKMLLAQQTKIENLEHALQETKNNLLVAENTNHINIQSIEQARKTIMQLEQQIYQQQKDILSYKVVLSKNKADSPLVLRDFIVQATETKKVFRYKLILTRTDSIKKILKGNLNIYITGISNKKTKTVPLSEMSVTEGHDKSIPFSFEYLEMIPSKDQFAELILPDDFTPKTIKIIAHLSAKNKPTTYYFDWAPIPLPTQEPTVMN